MSEIVTFGNGGFAFAGPAATSIAQAMLVKVALSAYKRSKLQVNRAYTPANMLRTAGRITGKTFKRGQYQQAIDALEAWIAASQGTVPVRHET